MYNPLMRRRASYIQVQRRTGFEETVIDAQEAYVCEQTYEKLAGGLSTIHHPSCEIAWTPRAGDPWVNVYLDAVVHSGVDSARWMAQWKKGDTIVDGPWPRLSAHLAFGRDLLLLAATLCTLLDKRSARLRIELTTQTTCPRFHVDNVEARLLCTLRGPGTEYLEGGCADRSRLGSASAGLPDDCSGLILERAGLHRIPTLAIAVLKGERWPDRRSGGAIHRSPSMPPKVGPRVTVAIDVP